MAIVSHEKRHLRGHLDGFFLLGLSNIEMILQIFLGILGLEELLK